MILPIIYNPKLNYKENENNQLEFDKVKKSLQKFGQLQPIIVRQLDDEIYEIVNGYHRFEAMKELGYTEIEVKDLGKIDFDQAVAIALQTEDTKIPIDNVELASLINTLVTEEKPIEYWSELLPYDAELIKSKIELINFDFSQYEKEQQGASLSDLTYSFKCKDESELAKIKDYFDQFPEEERSQALFQLIG